MADHTILESVQSTSSVALNPESKDEVLLSVQDLQVWFELRRFGFGHAGYVHAVDHVSFDLHHGEAIAIVGESGCGKSSLMKTILGLNRITGGAIYYKGQSIAGMKHAELRKYRAQVGYVQQDPYGAMAPFMSVEKILEEPLLINTNLSRPERLQRIEQALTEVKVTPVQDFLPKFPHMLSGGQQQRVVIARAMILEPQLVVADEPVSMLDASVRVEILKLLRSLQEKHNLAVIYITHDLSTVRYFSRRIFVMYAGNLVEKAKTEDLLRNPSHPYTQALLTGTSEPDANNAYTFKEVPPGEPPNLIRPPAGCRFHPRCARMISGVCDVEVPPDFQVEPDHTVRCWLYK
ncbi:MAG TPA: oligopeptide ABC transporter ATP-binding protein [Anaerolinea thermolimosa]|uniref:Oligopeptide ABC transporter ATP-binding protein n=1 Tax=Anaerolinea thermolimosa TaxID=229919 RepID=A0A3D1JJH7_9CHLR|nr:ABC transporter ATP-binding protein [Anaerolinea thermolimosa]GAP07696.1 oligopeptide/dipeptide ABC transporter, ATP-binding protein, C-terminal domain [Anaerolinea thermolimosa]HCE17918.1 oligopeptide ABC transporter ATP-binding protein [Anaerolinea thermolimosa]